MNSFVENVDRVATKDP